VAESPQLKESSTMRPDTPSKPELAPHMAQIEVEHTVIVALRPEARRRDVSVERLVQNILNVLVTDRLVTAVLDD
jgi:hypothetical protein